MNVKFLFFVIASLVIKLLPSFHNLFAADVCDTKEKLLNLKEVFEISLILCFRNLE